MRPLFMLAGLCALLGASFLSVEAAMAIDKNAVTKGAGKTATRTLKGNVGTIPTGPIALTDAECRSLGCQVHLDTGCATVFSDGIPKTGHRCVCASGSACIDKDK
jgi:hypothetical protein